MERKEVRERLECSGGWDGSREGLRTNVHLHGGWSCGCLGPYSATHSVWGDLGQSFPLPGLSFLACEMGMITSPLFPPLG